MQKLVDQSGSGGEVIAASTTETKDPEEDLTFGKVVSQIVGIPFQAVEGMYNKVGSTYETLTNYFGKNPYSIFFSGGTAGITAWAFIYPADYIKTRMQFYQKPFGETAQEILRKEGVKGMYKGCCLALTRAFILHCGVFSGYEFTKQLFNDR